jgi:transposase
LVDTFDTLLGGEEGDLMAKTRREFTPEFKREAVALLESSGRPQMQIAAELGIQPSMLRQWRATLNGVALRSRSGASLGV